MRLSTSRRRRRWLGASRPKAFVEQRAGREVGRQEHRAAADAARSCGCACAGKRMRVGDHQRHLLGCRAARTRARSGRSGRRCRGRARPYCWCRSDRQAPAPRPQTRTVGCRALPKKAPRTRNEAEVEGVRRADALLAGQAAAARLQRGDALVDFTQRARGRRRGKARRPRSSPTVLPMRSNSGWPISSSSLRI